MNSLEVARELNIESSEFQKIESSIAQVLGLTPGAEGRYEYSEEHFQALKEVFTAPVGSLDFLSDNEEGFSESGDSHGPVIAKTSTVQEEVPAVPEKPSKNKSVPKEKPGHLPLKKEKKKPVLHRELMPEHEPSIEEEGERQVISALGAFERLSRDVDGTPIPVEETAYNPELQPLVSLMERQKTYFEGRIHQIEHGDMQILRSDNFQLRKEINALRKEIKTLENIIRNQNEDKKILIQKLQEKFSIKNMFQWHSNDSKIFGQDFLG